MSFAINRRGALHLMTSGLAAGAGFAANPAWAGALISAFAQALSAAAQDNEALAAFYRDRNYATLWTGTGDVARLAGSSERFPSWEELQTIGLSVGLAEEAVSGGNRPKSIITVEQIGGRKYLAISVAKSPGEIHIKRTVEVSPNLLDWYSGRNHTTVLQNDAKILKVRDNTPVTPEAKRYIRLK